MAPDHRAGLCGSFDPGQFPLRQPSGLARAGKDLKPIYTAATEAAALERLADFAGKWETKYPAIVKVWESSWAEFVPFLAFDAEIRTVIYTTNAIESVNARIRKAVKARGHFPNEQAALKCVYLAVMSLDPTEEAVNAGPIDGSPH